MAQNVVIRKANPGQGQGQMRAISQRTGWEYEHDETDEQIDAIEGLIAQIREQSGAATDNDGRDEQGLPLRGATFSFTSTTDKGVGDIIIGTAYCEDGPADSVVNPGAGFPVVTGKQWVSEAWRITPDGKVTADDGGSQ